MIPYRELTVETPEQREIRELRAENAALRQCMDEVAADMRRRRDQQLRSLDRSARLIWFLVCVAAGALIIGLFAQAAPR